MSVLHRRDSAVSLGVLGGGNLLFGAKAGSSSPTVIKLQNASTTHMIFDVATQVSLRSDAMLPKPGDVMVTGISSGVGLARNPMIFMKPGDVCEVEVEGIGLLSNPVVRQD